MATPPLEARHQPSGLNALFQGEGLTFAEYVARTRSMLLRVHYGSADTGRIIEGNEPFELKPAAGFPAGQHKPYRRGILLTHGLTGSPYFMRYLAEFFRENGFLVMAVLLPGHGTQPGDLLEIDRREWIKTLAYGTEQLAEQVDEVYLAGYSIGGTLSVIHSLLDPRVRGLFLFSPALRITRQAALANLHKVYSWLVPSAKWVDILPDRDIYKYESFTKNAAAQTYALTRELNRKLQGRGLDIPVFAVASENDMTVDTGATLDFMARARHPSSKLVYYTTRPEISPHGIPAEKLELLNSVLPAQRILSLAHTAIVIPPEDRHYGVAGEYCNCVHYYPHDMEKFTACLTHPEQDQQGEVTAQNLAAGVMRRLMYNPHFAALKNSMQRFIEFLP